MGQGSLGVWALLLVGCASVTLLVVIGKARIKSLLGRVGKRAKGACVHLGLSTDPFSRYAEPTVEHRCYAYMHRDRIDLAHQERFCLTGAHARCPFLAARPPNALEQAREQLPRVALERARHGWEQLPGLAAAMRAQANASARQGTAHAAVAVRVGGAASGRAMRTGVQRTARGLLHVQANTIRVMCAAVAGTARAGRRAALAVWQRRANARLLVRDGWTCARATAGGAARAISRSALLAMRGGHSLAAWSGTTAAHGARGSGMWLAAGGRAGFTLWVALLVRLLAAVRALRGTPSAMRRPRVVPPIVAPAASVATAAEPAVAVASPMPQPTPVPPAPLTTASPLPAGLIVPADAATPGLLGRLAARHEALLEQGIAAMESGREDEARACFLRAVEANPRSEAAWYWRAKTAESLGEVIVALEHAQALNPANAQVRDNLAWARRRQEREGNLAVLPAAVDRQRTINRADFPLRRSFGGLLAAFVLGVLRSAGACASVALGAGWIAGGLPAALRQVVVQATSADFFAVLPVVSVSRVLPAVHFELLAGYDLVTAVPFAVGTLALLLAAGLVNREGWTRLWGPALALGSGWVWLGALGASPTSLAAALCGLVALGGVAVRDREYA